MRRAGPPGSGDFGPAGRRESTGSVCHVCSFVLQTGTFVVFCVSSSWRNYYYTGTFVVLPRRLSSCPIWGVLVVVPVLASGHVPFSRYFPYRPPSTF